MNQLTRIYKDNQIRIAEKDGEIWFVAKDVANVLGYSSTKDLARRLEEDEKGRHLMPTPGGAQEMIVINEPGLYNAILGSKREEAKDFKRWITHDVLPSIRRTGSYSVPANVPAMQYMDAKTIQHLSTIMQSFSEMARDCSIMSEQLGYYRQFAPTGDYGDPNRDGVPRYQKRRGYFVSNRGADVARSENPEKSNYHQLDLFYDRLPEILIQSAKILQDKFAALNSPESQN